MTVIDAAGRVLLECHRPDGTIEYVQVGDFFQDLSDELDLHDHIDHEFDRED